MTIVLIFDVSIVISVMVVIIILIIVFFFVDIVICYCSYYGSDSDDDGNPASYSWYRSHGDIPMSPLLMALISIPLHHHITET